MVRKWPLAAAISALVTAGSAYALGIGDIEVRSALNEHLIAEIRVHSSVPGEVDDLNVRLASPADFAAAGVERAHHLSTLKFAPGTDRAGRPIVKVSSPDPVKEPYLNFLLEFTWPKGRVLREYTVLLDPPVTMAGKTAPAKTSAAAAKSAARAEPATTPAPTAVVQPAVAAPTGDGRFPLIPIAEARGRPRAAEVPASFTGDSYGPTISTDTLWSIANKVKPANVSTQQMMLALLKANPQAFAGDSIHGLKSGHVLRIPASQDAVAVPAADVAAQTKAPAKVQAADKPVGVAKAEPAPSKTGPGTAASAPRPAAEAASQLKIVAPSTATAAATSGTGKAEAAARADVERLQRELTLANETIASQRLENAELQSRVRDLESAAKEIERLKKLVEVQNADLARLQQKAAEPAKPLVPVAAERPVAAAPKPAEPVKAEAPAAAPAPTPAPAEPLVKALPDTASAVAAETKPTEPAKSEVAKPAQAVPPGEKQPAAAAAKTDEVKPAEIKPDSVKLVEAKPAEPVVEAAKPKKPKKPAPPPPPPPEPDFVEEFGGLIGGALAALVLAVLGLFGFKSWKKRREAAAEAGEGAEGMAAGSEAETEVSFDDAFSEESPAEDITDKRQAAATTQAPAGPATQREMPQTRRESATPTDDDAEDKTQIDLGDIFESAEPETAGAAPAPAAGSDDTPDDVMGEADVYAAFGDYDQAATTMRNAIAAKPGKAMYKLKLLEIFRDAGDKANFQKVYGEFAGGLTGREASRAEEMAKAMGVSAPAGGAFLDTVSALDTQRMPSPPPAAAGVSASMSDTQEVDFDLDFSGSGADSQTGSHLDTLVMPGAPKIADTGTADTMEYGNSMPSFADTAVLSNAGGISPSGSSEMLPDTVEMASALPGLSEMPSAPIADTAQSSGDSLEFDLNLASLGSPSLDEAKSELAADDSNLLSFDVDTPTVVMDPAKEAKSAGDVAADGGLDMGLDFNLEPSAAVSAPEAAPTVADDSTMLLLDDTPAEQAVTVAEEELSLGSMALEGDEVATKLDLARAYIDMGDPEAAKDILGEVLTEGNVTQQEEAQKLMGQLGA